MKIYSIYDAEFKKYGAIHTCVETKAILTVLKEKTPCPDGVEYVPEDANLAALSAAKDVENMLFGGQPAQLGWCNGHNTRLNCLEYHRDSEFNLGTEDFILLLGLQAEIEEDGFFDTKNIKAFRVPAGVMVEVYATTMHYAPCSSVSGQGFKVLVALPKGTNTAKPDFVPADREGTLLTARNKWLLAHAESAEAASGAVVALKGENTDIAALI